MSVIFKSILSLILSLYSFIPIVNDQLSSSLGLDSIPSIDYANEEINSVSVNLNNTIVINAQINDSETICKVSLNNFEIKDCIVKFAVWSENNWQDDLIWYDGVYSNGQWFNDKVYVSNHKSWGLYHVHAYYYINNLQSYIGCTNFTVSKPEVASTTISNIDFATLTGHINSTNIHSPSGIEYLKIAIWTEMNGQDDLEWIQMSINPAQLYYFNGVGELNISNHNMELGLYNFHLYIYTTNGIYQCISTLQQNINFDIGNLSCLTNNDDSEALINLQNTNIPDNWYIQFAVWSDENWQDDLAWYKADKVTNSDYQARVNIRNHNSFGLYYVHLYIYDKNDQSIFAGLTTFNIELPTLESVSINSFNSVTKSFSICLNNILCKTPINSFTIAVWTDYLGQDDLRFYNVDNNSNDIEKLSFEIFIENHKYELGNYNVHIYCTSINGKYLFLNKQHESIGYQNNTLSAELSNDESSATIKLQNVSAPEGWIINFAVWTEEYWQDDLRWYEVEKKEESLYSYDLSTNLHKTFGKTYIHAYIINNWGQRFFLNETFFTTQFPTCNLIKVDNEIVEDDSFYLKIYNLRPSEIINNIRVAAWTDSNWQDDLYWHDSYTWIKESDDTYTAQCKINTSFHKSEVGIYHLHVYITCNNNLEKYLGNTVVNIRREAGSLNAEITNDERYININYSNLSLAPNDSIKFAVWSEIGWQDDLRYYDSYYNQENKTFYCNVDLRNHKNFGKYFIHAYIFDSFHNNIQAQFLDNIEIIYNSAVEGYISVDDIDGHTGKIDCSVFIQKSEIAVANVTCPVWGDYTDSAHAKWYGASKESFGTYKLNIDVKYHELNFGNYNIHAYVELNNGILFFINLTSANIIADNYIDVAYLGGTQFKVVACGLPYDDIVGMQFPTWSDPTKSKDPVYQDDIMWYQGSSYDSKYWYCYWYGVYHWPAGNFFTDVYATRSSQGSVFLKTLSFDVPPEAIDISGNAQLDLIVKNIIRSYPSLDGCFNYVSHCFSYRSGDVWPVGEWTIPYAIEMATYGSGNCYRFAALFLWCARALGYSANAISGQVPSSRGGLTPHGWVEVYLNGQIYVCDPDLEHELPGHNWYMTTYAAAPVDYYK